ncbi:hypothetical protein SAMN04488065_0287 [Haloplanus vescus]|uniref:Phosphatidate cytidylyltransferase n=1 Tax=Haloplanus vescus TaxID=555874 RepID=A0A1H3VUP3_9EURY|nr:hypothetical protein SAMN04488065_0287 [Haloplanus vescus]
MVPSNTLRDRISVWRGLVTVGFLLAVVALTVAFDGRIRPSLALLCGLTFVFLLGSAVDAVRTHPLYTPLSAIYTTLLFGVAYVVTGSDAGVLLALTGLSALGALVEIYNYTHGTSYLRLDFDGGS